MVSAVAAANSGCRRYGNPAARRRSACAAGGQAGGQTGFLLNAEKDNKSLSDSSSPMTHVWVKVGQLERGVCTLARAQAWGRGLERRQIAD